MQMATSTGGRSDDQDEWALLDAACGGDEQAFGALFARYRSVLETVCGLMLGDPQEAEDAMRDAILTAWRERGLASAHSSVRMWLYRITVRECMRSDGRAKNSRTGDRDRQH
jgi:RNA polymerase sigma-70 factor (ECF subfamily)